MFQEQMQQLVEEIQDLAKCVKEMNVSLEKAVRDLRAAADSLDRVWRKWKRASAVGSGAEVTGGVLTVFGGVATIMTGGAATPLLIAGTAFGVAGTCTNLFASAMEASNNSSKIQEADRAMENANRAIETVSERINQLKTGKSQIRLVFLAGLAIRMLGKNHLVVAIIEELLPINLLTNVLPIVGRRAFSKASTKVASEAAGNAFAKGAEGGSKTAGKAGAQGGAKAAGSFIVGVNAVFLILDVADFFHSQGYSQEQGI